VMRILCNVGGSIASGPATRGQNKSCSKSYAKVERNVNCPL
jgi:hypothetical protein